MKRLDYINALRGFAVLGVILVHTKLYGHFDVPEIMRKIVGEGARGVQLFYIASAFTIFLSYKNRVNQEISPIRNFFIRRFFRIAPMYYLGILYYIYQDGLGSRYFLGDATHISTFNIISNFLFLHGFYPYWITSLVPGGWSIAVEMTFYALIPFLFLKIKNINNAFSFFFITLLFKAILHLILINSPLITDNRLWGEYLFLYFPSQLPVFALGIIMFFFITKDENKTFKLSGKLLLVLGCILLVQFTVGIEDLILSNHILFGISFLIIGIALSKYNTIIIVNPIINYIGKISFSMYLVHFAVLHWLLHFNFTDYFNEGILNYITRFYLVIILTVIISTITYYLIEIPFQNYGRKIINNLENRTTTSEKKKSNIF